MSSQRTSISGCALSYSASTRPSRSRPCGEYRTSGVRESRLQALPRRASRRTPTDILAVANMLCSRLNVSFRLTADSSVPRRGLTVLLHHLFHLFALLRGHLGHRALELLALLGVEPDGHRVGLLVAGR